MGKCEGALLWKTDYIRVIASRSFYDGILEAQLLVTQIEFL